MSKKKKRLFVLDVKKIKVYVGGQNQTVYEYSSIGFSFTLKHNGGILLLEGDLGMICISSFPKEPKSDIVDFYWL